MPHLFEITLLRVRKDRVTVRVRAKNEKEARERIDQIKATDGIDWGKTKTQLHIRNCQEIKPIIVK